MGGNYIPQWSADYGNGFWERSALGVQMNLLWNNIFTIFVQQEWKFGIYNKSGYYFLAYKDSMFKEVTV